MPPILQLALDFVDLHRAVHVAERAVPAGVDWVEAGTPLIKSEGLDAVRELKRLFPGKAIVADMKIMDAGRIEVEAAAKAGAQIIDVLGTASDATIEECVAAGKNYGARIAVDLIAVADPVVRAKQVEELGADYITVHVAIDEQMRGRDPFTILQAVSQAVQIPVGVAGGINSETAAAAVAHGATYVIVGGAITKALDPEAATREIRLALDEGLVTPTTLFKRVGEEDIRRVLEMVSAANLSDALHRGGVLEGLRPLFPGARLVGKALTVRTYPGDWAKPVEAIDVAQPGGRPGHRRRRGGAGHLGGVGHPLGPASGPGRGGHRRGHPGHRRHRQTGLSSLLAPGDAQRRGAPGLRRDRPAHPHRRHPGGDRRLDSGGRRRGDRAPRAHRGGVRQPGHGRPGEGKPHPGGDQGGPHPGPGDGPAPVGEEDVRLGTGNGNHL